MKNRIVYFYDPSIGNFNYSPGHPMKPHRVRMTHSLLVNYGLTNYMDTVRPSQASFNNLTNFHSADYINFLQSVSKSNMSEMFSDLQKFNVGDDCPVFDGLYDYCRITTGGSLCGAYKLNTGQYDIAINWSGGLHHAKRNEASGFCYVNDIVIAILELLKYNERVLYIDIDVHHGDGVEEAFYTSDRVMTVSFHKYGEYFPGTGSLSDVGILKGKNYAVNVPLKDGINDESYSSIFKPVISKVMEHYRPTAIVMQCGADSLAGDRLGCFNLSHFGHSSCINFVKSFNVPLLVLGGGGYTIKNVSKAWAYDTSVILGVEIPQKLPFTEYIEHYGPDYNIDVPVCNMANDNTQEYLDSILKSITDNLRTIESAPSVQMVEIPPNFVEDESDEEILWQRFKEEAGYGNTNEEDLDADDVRIKGK